MVVNNSFTGNIKRIQLNDFQRTQRQVLQGNGEFERLLQENIIKQSGVKFSKHAELRLQMRNINLSNEQRQRIDMGVRKAQDKGVKDSLILMDNLAFVVNVKSKTVITAVSNSELKENVFTNIDGAVIV
ncbi:MAG TPA: flagellar biosynthesis protein [Clostridiaceae bacterium]|nr:flagellar biosynthesis protein [Clostridiaceae bacterium]HHV99045.1 flagellar biosynthesis protein [Clostridiaceae bacterium]